MSEEDFVFAWVLAHRAACPETIFSNLCNRQVITQAKEIYKQIKESCNETDSRTED